MWRFGKKPSIDSDQQLALFGVAKKFWWVVPPWWKTGELVATVKNDRVALRLRSPDFPDKPLPSGALFQAVRELMATGIADRDPVRIVLRIRGSNPPTPEIVAISDPSEEEATECDSAPDGDASSSYELGYRTPAAADTAEWEMEFLTLHGSQLFHRIAKASATDEFLHRVGLPAQGLFSFRMVFPESGLVRVEDTWPGAALRHPGTEHFGVLGTSKVNLLCRDPVTGAVIALSLCKDNVYVINKNVATFAQAATIYSRPSTSSAAMERWLRTHDPASLTGFWEELIGELRESEA